MLLLPIETEVKTQHSVFPAKPGHIQETNVAMCYIDAQCCTSEKLNQIMFENKMSALRTLTKTILVSSSSALTKVEPLCNAANTRLSVRLT